MANKPKPTDRESTLQEAQEALLLATVAALNKKEVDKLAQRVLLGHEIRKEN